MNSTFFQSLMGFERKLRSFTKIPKSFRYFWAHHAYTQNQTQLCLLRHNLTIIILRHKREKQNKENTNHNFPKSGKIDVFMFWFFSCLLMKIFLSCFYYHLSNSFYFLSHVLNTEGWEWTTFMFHFFCKLFASWLLTFTIKSTNMHYISKDRMKK